MLLALLFLQWNCIALHQNHAQIASILVHSHNLKIRGSRLLQNSKCIYEYIYYQYVLLTTVNHYTVETREEEITVIYRKISPNQFHNLLLIMNNMNICCQKYSKSLHEKKPSLSRLELMQQGGVITTSCAKLFKDPMQLQKFTLNCCFLAWRRVTQDVDCYSKMGSKNKIKLFLEPEQLTRGNVQYSLIFKS